MKMKWKIMVEKSNLKEKKRKWQNKEQGKRTTRKKKEMK